MEKTLDKNSKMSYNEIRLREVALNMENALNENAYNISYKCYVNFEKTLMQLYEVLDEMYKA